MTRVAITATIAQSGSRSQLGPSIADQSQHLVDEARLALQQELPDDRPGHRRT